MFSKQRGDGYMSTLRDVAKLAGVSLATASRILSNDESFKATEATRKKIEDAVREHLQKQSQDQ